MLRSPRRRPVPLLLGMGLAAAALALACGPGETSRPGEDMGDGATGSGYERTITADALESRLGTDEAPLVLDVRTEREYAAGHIPGAVNIPHDELPERLDELPADRDTEIVVHCQSGKRAAIAERVLAQAGYGEVRDLDGHWAGWSAEGLPTEQ